MKLTEAQKTTLALIADGKIYQQKFGYGAWRIQEASPQVVGRIISMGLAKWGEYSGDTLSCHITEAGRAALKGQQHDK